MFKSKSLILIVLLAFVSVSCGTDGLDGVNQSEQLSFANSSDLSNADYVFAGNQYSFTLNVEGGTVSNVNLTSFTDGGDWLNAQVVNNGSAIELVGTPASSEAFTEYSYSVTAIQGNEQNTSQSFAVFVDN